jgi:hypothetical protein
MPTDAQRLHSIEVRLRAYKPQALRYYMQYHTLPRQLNYIMSSLLAEREAIEADQFVSEWIGTLK